MAGRPYHIGHDMLIRMAARENDIVHVYASMSDRDNVSGTVMAQIWRDQIEPSLPANVKVSYGGSPVGKVFKELGDANADGSTDTFTVYSDPNDIAGNYGQLSKYAGNLIKNGQVHLRPISRSETVNVSGTMMRKWLAAGDKQKFVAHLPKTIDRNKVWELLQKSQSQPKARPRHEGLLRDYVRLLLND